MNKIVIRQPLTLQVWQEDPNLPPSGITSRTERPIGYAMLTLTWENKTQQLINLKLTKIEVHPVGSKEQLMSLAAFDLTLNPLEISPQQYRLTNKEGYGDAKQVEAIIIYEVEGQSYRLISPPVNVK